ncbi:elongation factor P--(R)-beta-lysine ligase, partial [Candidatus Uhrbacteria bacterium CG_4_9_14_3_um_filter_36_7]
MFLQTIVKQRNQLLQTIRDFFQNRGYLEVETPLCVPSPGMEPNLSPIEVKIKDVCGKTFQAGLITSPEYSMKKLLGHGFEKIFTITKVFRNEEPFDETHNIEFTMLEWYCQGKNYKDCMDETEDLIKACALAFMSSKAHP